MVEHSATKVQKIFRNTSGLSIKSDERRAKVLLFCFERATECGNISAPTLRGSSSVGPDGKRALKNTGSENLTMLCIQYKANAFTEADSPMTDGTILQEELKW